MQSLLGPNTNKGAGGCWCKDGFESQNEGES